MNEGHQMKRTNTLRPEKIVMFLVTHLEPIFLSTLKFLTVNPKF